MSVAQSAECPVEKPWAVIDGDKVSGCYASEEEAKSAEGAPADGPPAKAKGGKPFAAIAGVPEGATPFVGVAVILDYETSDGRLVESAGFSWRPLPLPLMYQDTNPDAGGHAGAVLVGSITEVLVKDRRVWMAGYLDEHASDRSASIVELVRNQTARFVSVDLMGADVEVEVRAVDDAGWPSETLMRMGNGVMGGATVTPFPAIPDAVIWLAGEAPPVEVVTTLPDVPERVAPEDQPEVAPEIAALLASAAMPSYQDFQNPGLTGPSPGLTVTDDGRVFGHAALWGTCHTGLPGCVTPPSSPSDYAYFLTGAVWVDCDCADCDPDDPERLEVAVGTLTVGTLHAGDDLTPGDTIAHYEHTGAAVAQVVAGEDQFGIWLSGRVLPDATEEQIARLRASSPSGDWRRIGGALELVAVLGVNTPGFPVPRPRMRVVASAGGLQQTSLVGAYDPRNGAGFGGEESLVASGFMAVPRSEYEALVAKLDRLERDLGDLRPLIADRIAQRLS